MLLKTRMFCICILAGMVQLAMADMTCLKAIGVSGGEDHTLAVMKNGTVWGCGSNASKQLGIGKNSLNSLNLIQAVGGNMGTTHLENITQVDAGWEHSLALDEDGYVWAWGSDVQGQLGNGTDEGNSNYPIQVVGSDPNGAPYLSDIVFMSAGRSGLHSLACDSDGAVWAWGFNNSGQCGNDTTVNQHRPVQVISGSGFLGDVSKITEVDAGSGHSLALDEDGDVWTWGRGQLTAVKVDGLDSINIVEISAGEKSLARDSDGYVWSWGSTNGTVTQVAGGEMETTYLENIAAIGEGESHHLALDGTGRLWAWGVNSQGELGNDTNGTTNQQYPVAVLAGEMQTASGVLERIEVIDAGWEHSMAIDDHGEIWAWGYNQSGQLGTGDKDNRFEPVLLDCADTEEVLTDISINWDSVDPNSCVCPVADPDITYTITYTVEEDDITTAMMTIYLPREVDYLAADPDCGMYDEDLHSYTTMVEDISTTATTDSIDIDVVVNNFANPAGVIVCRAYVDVAESFAEATRTINICCRGGSIIYVDRDAVEVREEVFGVEYVTGMNTGLSWENAYRDLQDALTRAGNDCGSVIWVVKGHYLPTLDTNNINASFDLVEGIGMFGGFESGETSLDQRVFDVSADPNNGSVLNGDITGNLEADILNVVTATGTINAAFDGFTVRHGKDVGLMLDDADPAITRCVFIDNELAIDAKNFSEPEIANCRFYDNTTSDIKANLSEITITGSDFDGKDTTTTAIDATGSNFNIADSKFYVYTDAGIMLDGSNLTMSDSAVEYNGADGISSVDWADTTITNSIIRYNGDNGIIMEYGQDTEIRGSVIYSNGQDNSTAVGIFLNYPIATADIFNNTIIDNAGGGIYQYSGVDQNVKNCIVYDNGTTAADNIVKESDTFGDVSYSCVEGGFAGSYNISDAPAFYDPTNLDDFHLSSTSPCINAGDPNISYYGQVDLDGEDRVKNGRVDIGADEYYWSLADFDESGNVDFFDFAQLAAVWYLSTGDDGYDDTYDLVDDGDIDIIDESDLIAFGEEWLWEAGWLTTTAAQSSMMSAPMTMLAAPESMTLSSTMSIALEPIAKVETQPTARTINSGPINLKAVTQKTKDLYTIRAEESDRPKVRKLPIELMDTEAMLQLLDEIWEETDISDSVSKKEWQKFIENIKQAQ